MPIVWLSLAVRDLAEIRSYLAAENPAAARKVADRIKQSVSQLGEMPKIGRVGRVFGTRELVISPTSYIVAYRVSKNQVEILRVLHGAQEWPDAF
jgi:addiction module RelE/StbE family toxin